MISLGKIGSLDFAGGKLIVDVGFNDPTYGGAKLEVDLDVADILAHLSAGVTNATEKAILDGALAILKALGPAAPAPAPAPAPAVAP